MNEVLENMMQAGFENAVNEVAEEATTEVVGAVANTCCDCDWIKSNFDNIETSFNNHDQWMNWAEAELKDVRSKSMNFGKTVAVAAGAAVVVTAAYVVGEKIVYPKIKAYLDAKKAPVEVVAEQKAEEVEIEE